MKCLRCYKEITEPVCNACGYSHKKRVRLLKPLPPGAYEFKKGAGENTQGRPTEQSNAGRNLLIAVAAIVVGLIVGFSIYSWTIGRWLVGILLGALTVVATVCLRVRNQWYIPQLWTVGILSVTNVALSWLFPAQYSAMAIPVALGNAVALFLCTHYAYQEQEEDIGALAAAMMVCNLVIAIAAVRPIQPGAIWAFALLAVLFLTLAIVSFYNKWVGENGIAIASIVVCLTLGIHVLLVCTAPHFTHSLHRLPELQDKDYGNKSATCCCGQEIEVSQFLGEMIHGFTCEDYDLLLPLNSITYRADETNHWPVCKCGAALGATEAYEPHKYENGYCKTCGHKSE